MANPFVHDLRVELRTRNNVLWHAIFDTSPSVAQFCRTHDLYQGNVGKLLNLKDNPYSGKHGRPSKLALRLADIAGMLVEDLFPKDLYSGVIPQHMVAEIPSHLYRPLAAASRLALPAPQDDMIEAFEMRETLEAVLSTLTPREQVVMRHKFGLDDRGDGLTQDKIALELGVSRMRIHQIEAKAFKKLRHPSRSRQLRTFLEGRTT